jgi:class 3 adenylate cyclase
VADLISSARALRVSGTDYQHIFLSPEIPEEVARFVARKAVPDVPDSVLATLLFTDIVGSTERAAELGDRTWRELLERHHALVRRELTRFRGEERDTAGDGFFATFDGPARAIRCAQALVNGVRELGLEVRAGVHTGECELHDGKVAGLAVSIGARVAASAGPNEVLVSQTVKDLVAGTGVVLEDRGERDLKGVPGRWRVYQAIPPEPVVAAD